MELGDAPNTNKPVVIDIGFGDAQSFSKDVLANQDYCFIGIEPYKKGFARAIEFYETYKPDNLFLFNGDAREYIESVNFDITDLGSPGSTSTSGDIDNFYIYGKPIIGSYSGILYGTNGTTYIPNQGYIYNIPIPIEIEFEAARYY